jgi:hypothetical protein
LKPVLITFLFSFLFLAKAIGQDVLHKTNGHADTVIVLEITPKIIIYNKYNDSTHKRLTINKTSVIYIEYADGNVDVMEKPDEDDDEFEDDEPWPNDFQNSVSLNWLSIMMGDLNVGYELSSKEKDFSVRLNANYHFFDLRNRSWFANDRIYALRTDFNFFPGDNKSIRYFLGGSLRFAKVVKLNVASPSGFQISNKVEYRTVSAMFINGFQIETSTPIFISVMAGFGISSGKQLDNGANYGSSEGVAALNIGYKF